MGSRGAGLRTDKPAHGPSSLALVDAFSAFMRSYKIRMRSLLAELSSTESNPSRVMLVVSLRRSGPQTMGMLASHLGLPKSNITAIVDDLEGEGLLRRKQDATDRRVTQLELSAKGRALCEREYDAFERGLAAIFDELLPEERGPLFSGLQRLTKLLGEVGEGDVSCSSGESPGKSNVKKTRASKSFKK
jgi:DNA-binding MarR family transcriptional regulator